MSSIESLYEWVSGRYQEFLDGNITEEEYMKDLEFYKNKLAESEENIQEYVQEELSEEEKEAKPLKEKVNPSNVRSTSIAGLRKKLLDEMRK